MTTHVSSFHPQRTLIALAACAACLYVQAEPAVDASVSVGVGVLDGASADRALFGQYRGTRTTDKTVGLLGIDYSLRDEDAGKWVDFNGSNLFGESRELNFVWKNPGSWKFIANYSELLRIDPNTLNTTLVGVGSVAPILVSPSALPGAGTDNELKTKRSGLGLGFTKIISPALQLQVDLKSENKEGNHAFSLAYLCTVQQGSVCNTMVPEPVNSNHTQVEARATYVLDKLHLNVGYYGSFYRNSNDAINVGRLPTSSVFNTFNNLPVVLAPDNEAHQFDLSGSYDFSKATHGTFKLAWATASQNADFANAGLIGPTLPSGNVLSSAGARVDTTLAKVGFTSRPVAQMSLSGDLRYENKDDKTPLFDYNLTGPSTNHLLPNTKILGKVLAGWQFNTSYRGSLGADFESIDRGTYTASSILTGISALRQDTHETTVHADLRRQLSNDFSGTVGLSSSSRDGSNWLEAVAGTPGVVAMTTPASGAVFLPTQADRQRDKVKFLGEWQPNDKLNLQLALENGTDSYSAPTSNGLRDTSMRLLSVDWSYALTDMWGLNGSVSQSKQTLNQAYYAGTVMAFDNTNWGVNLGLTGKPSQAIRVGVNLSYLDDKSIYAQSPDAAASPLVATQLANSGGLPVVNYRQTTLKLFATYALEKKASVRLDLIHQRTGSNDWTWGYNGVPFTYSDGASVNLNPDQSVNFIGVSYVYQLR